MTEPTDGLQISVLKLPEAPDPEDGPPRTVRDALDHAIGLERGARIQRLGQKVPLDILAYGEKITIGAESHDLYVTCDLLPPDLPLRPEVGVLTKAGAMQGEALHLLSFLGAIALQPELAPAFYPGRTLMIPFGEIFGKEHALAAFVGLHFDQPIFLRPEHLILEIEPEGSPSARVFPLTAYPITDAEAKVSREAPEGDEGDALKSLLLSKLGKGEFFRLGARASAV